MEQMALITATVVLPDDVIQTDIIVAKASKEKAIEIIDALLEKIEKDEKLQESFDFTSGYVEALTAAGIESCVLARADCVMGEIEEDAENDNYGECYLDLDR